MAKDAIFPGSIAAGVTPWARLLTLAKDERRSREVRNSAVFWIAKSHRDPELRRTAIFWLGQSRDARAMAYFEEVLLPR